MRKDLLLAIEKPPGYDDHDPANARATLETVMISALSDFGGQQINATTGSAAVKAMVDAILDRSVRWALLNLAKEDLPR